MSAVDPNVPLQTRNFLNTFDTVLFAATGFHESFSTFRSPNDDHGYQVPEFFNFRVRVVQAFHGADETALSIRQPFYFGYGDDDVGMPSSSQPSNPQYFLDVSTHPSIFMGNVRKMTQVFTDFLIPSQTYPFCWDNGKTFRVTSQLFGNLEEIT